MCSRNILRSYKDYLDDILGFTFERWSSAPKQEMVPEGFVCIDCCMNKWFFCKDHKTIFCDCETMEAYMTLSGVNFEDYSIDNIEMYEVDYRSKDNPYKCIDCSKALFNPKRKSRDYSAIAKKGWETRRYNQRILSERARKGWITRRASQSKKLRTKI